MKKKYLILIINIFTSFILMGCWDNHDVNELSFATAIGIDLTNDNKIEVTIQIVKPDILKAIQQGSSESAFFIITGKGETAFEALRNSMSSMSNQTHYEYGEVIIISEDVAKKGILDVIDFFERNYEVKKRANVVISKGISAKEVLEAKSNIIYLSSEHIKGIEENTIELPKIIDKRLIDIMREISSKGKSIALSVIERKPKEELLPEETDTLQKSNIEDFTIETGAIFYKDKLTGWMNSNETIGYLHIINEVKSYVITVDHPEKQNKKVSIELNEVKTKLDVKIINNKPNITIKVDAKGMLADQQGGGSLIETEKITALENNVALELKSKMNEALKFAKEHQNDIFGFGEIVHRKDLKYWKTVENNWHQIFQEASVEIQIKVNIKRSGLIQGSSNIDE